MATFPTGVVSLTNPSSGTLMSVVSHADQHVKANDEIEAIETALGANLANVVVAADLDTDTMLAANSDTKVATQKAVKAYADAIVLSGGGIPIGYLDTDGTLAGNSDVKVATQKATKTYVDGKVAAGFGAPVAMVAGTTYLAATDGLVVGYGTATATTASILGYTDSAATPTTVVYKFLMSDITSLVFPVVFAVRKSEYYKIVVSSVDTITCNFIPVGS